MLFAVRSAFFLLLLGNDVYRGETYVGCFWIPGATVYDFKSCNYHDVNKTQQTWRQISAVIKILGTLCSSIVAEQQILKEYSTQK